MNHLYQQATALLKQLIAIPSFSKAEDKTAQLLADCLEGQGIPISRKGNNIWAISADFAPSKPTLLLNSHHDTVRPAPTYTRDPFQAVVEDGKLYGLGSNDAGGALVSLLFTFVHFRANDLPFNLCFLASAEEEISGHGGVESVLGELPPIWTGIVGEPTLLQMAVAEKGLMVLDGLAEGKSGHAARDEGVNAIYKAMEAIQLLKDFSFEETSPLLGPVKVSVTQVEAGSQHNVVPDACRFVVDVRTTECYSNEQVLAHLQAAVACQLTPRSLRLQPSGIPLDHPLVQAGQQLGMHTYGSPTLSDQALMPFPTLKLGPGDSARSHTADEFIYISEIEEGIETYIHLINQLAHQLQSSNYETLAKIRHA
ncbi:MAG: M20 family metallo-hydrolase [Bacteroidota bacterium]